MAAHQRPLVRFTIALLIAGWALQCRSESTSTGGAPSDSAAKDVARGDIAPPRRQLSPEARANEERQTDSDRKRRGTAGELNYFEMITGDIAEARSRPLIVAIHGLGDNPEHFSSLFGGFPSAARFILLEAPTPYLEGFSWFPFRTSAPDESLTPSVARAGDKIASAITALQGQAAVDLPVILTGFSQGGMLSYVVALQHPHLVSAALPIAGYLPAALVPASAEKAPPIFAFHGDQDRVIPIDRAQRTVAQLTSLGCSVHLATYPLTHETSPQLRADLFARLEEQLLRHRQTP